MDLFGRPAKPGQRGRGAAAANVRELISKRNYSKAIDALRAELQRRRGDERLRVQLADVLVLAGRGKEAVEILNALADDLALAGQAGKAITALKKIQKLGPGRDDIEEKLSYLIKHQSRPSFDPWARSQRNLAMAEPADEPRAAPSQPAAPIFGMEEITDEPLAEAAPAGSETATAAVAPPETPPLDAAGSAEGAPDAVPAGDAGAEPSLAELFSDDAARDSLVGMLEEVFTPAAGSSETARGGTALVETPLFRDFSQEELLAVIRGLRLHTHEPGEIIVSAGEPGDSLYILTSGSVRAYMRDKRGKQVQVREMHDGDFFGEMAVLTGNVRSATITASTHCELLELDRQSLNQIAATHPNVRVVLQEFYKKRARHSVDTLVEPNPDR